MGEGCNCPFTAKILDGYRGQLHKDYQDGHLEEGEATQEALVMAVDVLGIFEGHEGEEVGSA